MAEKFIQDVFAKAKKRHTLGDCSGSNYGGEGCPVGSKKYNFASLMRKISTQKKAKK